LLKPLGWVAQRQRHQSKITFDLSDDKNATEKWGNESEMCRREFGSWILYDSLLNDYSKTEVFELWVGVV
jgi:hypothetical protein